MQVFVAHTYEIDDANDAIADILRALPDDIIEQTSNKNAVGILTTHADAMPSGVVEALCDAMPFDVVGMTCFASCADGEVDLDLLTFVVLISDEIRFAVAMTDILYEQDGDPDLYKKSIEKAYAEIKNKLGSDFTKPALTIAYTPFIPEVPGQKIIDCIADVTNHAPLFGGIASDHTAYGDYTYVIHNGEHAKRKLALLCIDGPIKATFKYASLLPNNLHKKECIITSAEGTTVHTVNNIPIAEYVVSLGISPEDWQKAGIIVPFLVDYKDGTPFAARELLSFTKDDKHAVFGGEMPVGSLLYLGLQSEEGIMQSAENIIEDIHKNEDNLIAAFVICCVGRSLLLGANPLAEGQKALEILDAKLPYAQFYTRGEICPAQLSNGELLNRFHNFSFTVCMLEKS